MKQHMRSKESGKVPDIDVEGNVSDVEANNDVNKKKIQKIIKEYLIDYTENSNLHGLRYIGEKKRTPVEKVFWLLMFILCVIYCAILIQKVWKKWDESPVMVSFAESLTPAWKIPYPAVTICFTTKAWTVLFNFTRHYHLYTNETAKSKLTEEKKHIFEDFLMICDNVWAEVDFSDAGNYTDGNVTVKNIKKLSAGFEKIEAYCSWQDLTYCPSLFTPIITQEGLCQTFNTLGPEQLFRIENLHKNYEYMPEAKGKKTMQSWTLEGGYSPSTPLETYPYRGSGNGGKDHLMVQLFASNIELDYVCNNIQGYKIFLHNPAELPRVLGPYIKLPMSRDVMITFKPKMITTTEGLRFYDSSRRQCYFSDERYLQYFKIYTQSNCEIECLSNFTYARCGCVHFGLPHGPNMKTCGLGKMKCMTTARMELVQLEIQTHVDTKMMDNDINGEARAVVERCRCLPSCTSIEYEAETSQANIDEKALFKAYNEAISSDMSISVATINLKEPQFITVRRSELFGQVDFLANCGGLLGLFMGFSVLSVAEMIYFLTLRWWCLFRRNPRIN